MKEICYFYTAYSRVRKPWKKVHVFYNVRNELWESSWVVEIGAWVRFLVNNGLIYSRIAILPWRYILGIEESEGSLIIILRLLVWNLSTSSIRHVVRLLHIFKTVLIFLVSHFVYTLYVCTRTLFKIKHAFMFAFCVISSMWVFRLTLLLTCGFISHKWWSFRSCISKTYISFVFLALNFISFVRACSSHQVPLACFS